MGGVKKHRFFNVITEALCFRTTNDVELICLGSGVRDEGEPTVNNQRRR